MKMKIWLYLTILVALILTACQPAKKRYKIGFSQCSADVWREKLNREVQLAAYYYDNADVECTSAENNDQLQIKQVQQFIDQGVDLLIVSPNQIHHLTRVVNEAYDKGIPVILFDRNTNGRFTAFIGADNEEMGKSMGTYVAQQLNYQGAVLEITGLSSSTPATGRSTGFRKALQPYSGVKVVGTVNSDWTTADAYHKTKEYLRTHDVKVDYVFGQNDRMAAGARQAFIEAGKGAGVKFCGIDGLPMKGGGLEMVCDSILEATYVNPTRGDLVMKLAMDILEHRPYRKYNKLSSALVTHDVAPLMMMQADELSSQLKLVQEIRSKLELFLIQYTHQQVYLVLCVVILLLCVCFFVYFYRTMLYKHKVAEKMITDKLQHYMQSPMTQRNQAISDGMVNDEVTNGEAVGETRPQPDTVFMNRIFDCIMAHLSDPDFNVQLLAQELNISRVQLYRKVKALTSSTPVEMLKIARLQQADRLLEHGGKTISEISYDVGFSSPSYFSKCYKEYFGHLPTEKA